MGLRTGGSANMTGGNFLGRSWKSLDEMALTLLTGKGRQNVVLDSYARLLKIDPSSKMLDIPLPPVPSNLLLNSIPCENLKYLIQGAAKLKQTTDFGLVKRMCRYNTEIQFLVGLFLFVPVQ